MITPAVVAAIVFPLSMLSDSFATHFTAPLSLELQVTFFASLVVMVLHKIESHWCNEYDQCPVYVSQAVDNPRRAIFSLGPFPLWHDAVIGERGEDRRWIARAPESIWNPEAPGPVGAGVAP
jgi:hypothetical protein